MYYLLLLIDFLNSQTGLPEVCATAMRKNPFRIQRKAAKATSEIPADGHTPNEGNETTRNEPTAGHNEGSEEQGELPKFDKITGAVSNTSTSDKITGAVSNTSTSD